MIGVIFFNTALENLILLNFKRIVKIVTLYSVYKSRYVFLRY